MKGQSPEEFSDFLQKKCGISIADANDAELMAMVAAELDKDILKDAIEAEQQQTAIAQMHHAYPNMRAIDGMGPQVMALAPALALHLKCNEKVDFSSARDRKWIAQRYPGTEVRGGERTKLMVGYDGSGVRERVTFENGKTGKREDGSGGISELGS